MAEEEIRKYEPEIKPQTRLAIDGDSEGFEDVTGDDGLIHTKLNQSVIIQRISKDLYKSPKSGLRELYANSVRACQLAEEKYGRKGHISITLDGNPDTRKITIEDNGIGISAARFKNILLELGTSDNHDSGKTGQFGMGFAAYMTMSSVCIIDTVTDSGESYKMLAKDGASFQKMGKADRTAPGTTITMTPYQNVNMSDLFQFGGWLTRYSTVKTTWEVTEVEDRYGDKANHRGYEWNRMTLLDEAHRDEERSRLAKPDVLHINTDDYEFVARIGLYAKTRSGPDVFLCGVPIESEIRQEFNWWVLNIKNERKFLPMPDRDSMTEAADGALGIEIDEKVKEHLKGVMRGISTYKDFQASPYKQTFLYLIRRNEAEFTQERAHLWASMRGCSYQAVKVNGQYGTRNPADLVEFLDKDIVIIPSNNSNAADRVLKVMPNALCIHPKRGKHTDWPAIEESLREFGVPFWSDIAKRGHTKGTPRKTIIIHTHKLGKAYETAETKIKDINSRTIEADVGDLTAILHVMKKIPSKWSIVKKDAILAKTKASKMSKWLKRAGDYTLITNKGNIKVKDFSLDFTERNMNTVFVVDGAKAKDLLFSKRFADKTVIAGDAGALELFMYNFNQLCSDHTRKKISAAITTMHHFMYEKFGVSLSSTDDLEYFLDHYQEVDACKWQLFAEGVNQYLRGGSTDEERKAFSNAARARLTAGLKKMPNWKANDDVEEYVALCNWADGNTIEEDDSLKSQLLIDAVSNRIVSLKNAFEDKDEDHQRFMEDYVLPKLNVDYATAKILRVGSLKRSYDVIFHLNSTDFNFEDTRILRFDVDITEVKLQGKDMTAEVRAY